MLKKKQSGTEKKRKHSKSEERHQSNKRRSSESHLEDSKDELADPELDRIGSDIEEGGLDLSIPFQPITAYVSDKKEMLEQCFRVLGEKKLLKMLPDQLKDCGLEEIKSLCWEQLEPIPEKTLNQILAGEELPTRNGSEGASESQQDNNVDSTSCIKETPKADEPKDGGGSGDESDVLSINADTYDSDIEGPKEEQAVKSADVVVKEDDSGGERSDPTVKAEPPQKPETKKDIQSDIDKSVCEILAPSPSSTKEPKEPSGKPPPADVESSVGREAPSGSVCQPSIQQLELLELEMRARAIKALMKAGDKKKLCMTANS